MSQPSSAFEWSGRDATDIPYAVFRDAALFEREREIIFKGPFWHYLGLEAELPKPGDFVARFIGTVPVLMNRTEDGKLAAFVNRCAHRGAAVQYVQRGNCLRHICIYHQWTYDTHGRLVGVPYRRGVQGQGGFPADFRLEDHGLQPVRLAMLNGLIFGTLHNAPPALEDFLGPEVVARFGVIFNRSLKVIGYQNQAIRANWKLLLDNVKDSYHGAILHAFNSKFGFFDPARTSRLVLAGGGLHSMSTTNPPAADHKGGATPASLSLEDASMLGMPEAADRSDTPTTLMVLFPSLIVLASASLMSVRSVRPKAVDEVEVVWTYIGYADEAPATTDLRIRQMNLFGPAGYASIEDAHAVELIQASSTANADRSSGTAQLGGRGVAGGDSLITEAGVRAFWTGYRAVMGLHTTGGAP